LRIVLQRVSSASVVVEGKTVGAIGRGLLLLVGVHQKTVPVQTVHLARKCAELRIFADEAGKMNLSAKELDLPALVISQFTLYGDTRKGRRPNFMMAANAEDANQHYENFVYMLKQHLSKVETGVFGAMMEVHLVNDGPVTLILEEEVEEAP
jgi:D-aminoacyl-tRNA deacylase